jgi:hypothetical protein
MQMHASSSTRQTDKSNTNLFNKQPGATHYTRYDNAETIIIIQADCHQNIAKASSSTIKLWNNRGADRRQGMKPTKLLQVYAQKHHTSVPAK